MLSFGVVASRDGGSLGPGILQRLGRAAATEVPFPPDDSVTWTNDAGTVWFAGWRPPGRDHRDSGWHVDEDGLTAVAGRVWPRREGWKDGAPVATQLARRLHAEPLVTNADALAGVYVVASLARRGWSALAADPLGLGLLYWGRSEDVVVLSTRASIAASILAEATGCTPRRDAFGAGWLAYAGYPVGARTGFEGVSLVPAGTTVEIDPGGNVEARHPPGAVWRDHAEMLAADPQAALDDVREELGTAIRTALRQPEVDCRVGLTGGKDSRLILALLLGDGLAGDVAFQTFGSDDLPDMRVARTLASTFGLRHDSNPRTADRMIWRRRVSEAAGPEDTTWREITFRMTVAATSGTRNVGEPHLGRLPPPRTAVVSGLAGETLRSNHPGSIGLRSKVEAARFPGRFGTAEILDTEVLERYRRDVHEILFDGVTEGDSPQDVIDGFYLRQRLRRWAGATLEVDPEARILPLYSITAIRLAFGIGAENRHAEWIHHQLVREACSSLFDIPFADEDWAAGARGELVKPAAYDDTVPALPPPPMRRMPPRSSEKRSLRRDQRMKERDTDVAIMRRLFEPDAGNRAFDLLDRRGLQRAIDGFEDLAESDRRQLYGALSAVIWLGGHELALPRELATA